jgi:pantoate--beta-alanine ligase
LKTARSEGEMRSLIDEARREGLSVGLVPTMGALHEGHRSLLRAARATCDIVVMSIFVNPLQFGPNEDFERYPRSEQADLQAAEEEKVDIVFLPSVEEMYPPDSELRVEVGRLGTIVEGAARPGHFNGVATVVAKLFNLVEPDLAFFGQKDAQQAAVIRKLVRDLSMRTQIQVEPIVREHDGLALSSRNVYLSPEERAHAPQIQRGLRKAAELLTSTGDAGAAEKRLAEITAAAGFDLDYGLVVDPDSFEPWSSGPALIVVAGRLGATRLIDNLQVNEND